MNKYFSSTTTLVTILFNLPYLQAQTQDSSAFYAEDFTSIENIENRTLATFKSTRIVNTHTIKQLETGVLDMRISHRFGLLRDGINNFFGLDNATTRLGFDYGLTDYTMIGIGRSTLNKDFDRYIKQTILSQSTKIPISVAYIPGIHVIQEYKKENNIQFKHRLAYVQQILIARKFNEYFSLQLMPTYIHSNLTLNKVDNNNILSIGCAGRIKTSTRAAFTWEYFYTLPKYKLQEQYNPLSLGYDIDTGGHIFQLFLTNSKGMTERSMFNNTTSAWHKGEILIGFNISRVFTLHK